MTAVVSLYGRLGQDPRAITTASGKPMTVASVAVDIPLRGEDRHSEWFGLVAFGEVAERLLRQEKSDMVAVTGRLQLHLWEDRDGNERQQWQVVVDTLVSARTVRPGGKRKAPQQPAERSPADAEQAPGQTLDAEADFDDDIPF
jgi:single-strand DNA-binding protein